MDSVADTRPDAGSAAMQLGEMEVQALRDGCFELPASYMRAPDVVPDEVPDAGDGRMMHLDVNAFLIRTKSENLLVDTGGGYRLEKDANRLLPALAAAGLAPGDIDTVLITHIHPDHTSGLVGRAGEAIFPRARVRVHRDELAFWRSSENASRAPDGQAFQFQWAVEAFAPYDGRIDVFTEGPVLPGIRAISLFGHTPFHSGFVIDGGDRQLLIWGDCVHDIGLQAARPEIGFAMDMDAAMAEAARRKAFSMAADDGLLVAGMHVAFPGFGTISRHGTGFVFKPAV
ncbi:MBL fold metallo-hydrolase [Martelella endophytica]|nr:MBL fold metallo-hydrolase [Martelella endophytica]